VLKQKLKLMKFSLKEWHRQHFQNMRGRMTEVQHTMSALDIKAKSSALSDEEVAELHELSVNLHSMARLQNSINWQNSRMNWLAEGDANTKKFHGCMSNRRRQNAINTVSFGGVRVEGVQNVRAAVFSHFCNHFKSLRADRPVMEGLQFRQISREESASLIKPFTCEEVKRAVWDCDSFKSPGPDGVSFGFLKDFWDLLQEYLMRFLVEFHRNGKLTKGLNSMFIALKDHS